MEFDLQWLLFGLPVAFALGWLASRVDLRHWKREVESTPRAYFKGLNLLLNEQQDKAIDAFIEAVQQDPGSSDLHFALGNLFRRRGEYERAVRVHQHLLARADLPASERDRAQHALAQDFLKAGLFDRAEAAFKALEGSAFATDARLALLNLHERARDWQAAIDVARGLESVGAGSFAPRIAHYGCELALEADARGDAAAAQAALDRAREAAPQSPRPWVQSGQRLARAALHAQHPRADLLHALLSLDLDPRHRRALLLQHLQRQPSLSAAQALLREQGDAAASADEAAVLQQTLGHALRPLRRYRCAACGFEAQQHFWQCPGCHGWDTYPSERLEDQ